MPCTILRMAHSRKIDLGHQSGPHQLHTAKFSSGRQHCMQGGVFILHRTASLWYRGTGADLILITTVVDDMCITSSTPALTLSVIDDILDTFQGTHMGIVSHYNGACHLDA